MNLKEAWISFLGDKEPPAAHISSSETGEVRIFEFMLSNERRFGIAVSNSIQTWFYVDLSNRESPIMESGDLNISDLLIAGLGSK